MARLSETHLIVGPSLRIPLSEIELRASRSSGPGGQHANKTESRVEAVFNAAVSQAPEPAQRRRIVAAHGPVVRAVAQEARSQLRNRELALTRLGEKLERAIATRRTRVATKPSKGAQERRITAKRAQSEKKATRRRPSTDD